MLLWKQNPGGMGASSLYLFIYFLQSRIRRRKRLLIDLRVAALEIFVLD